jgi:hypothetical protein
VISAPSATPVAPSSPVSFETLLNLAFTTRDTRDYAEQHGVDETALVRFADGAVCDEEHRRITAVLAKNAWSLSFLSNLLKRRRGQPKRRVA